MNTKNPKFDSGSYVNGQYTSKNGFTGSGLNCPKGTRLFDPKIIKPYFIEPEDKLEGEIFQTLTQEVAPGVYNYYAISNYGRIYNYYTGQIMKEAYRPNGYGYYNLRSETGKRNQRKYSTHRMVMQTFEPNEHADDLVVNHINSNRKDNRYNVHLSDGTVVNNLEWSTYSENSIACREVTNTFQSYILSEQDVHTIRQMYLDGHTYAVINAQFPNVTINTIQNICRNKSHIDPNYYPDRKKNAFNYNIDNTLKLSDRDADIIRKLNADGKSYREIQSNYFPNVSIGTIGNICNYKTHDTRSHHNTFLDSI